MDEQPDAPTPAPVKDRREVPRGVLPRRFQTWLMAGLALGIVLIVLLTGHREPPARSASGPATSPAPNADRVRDYQDHLRTVEEQLAREAQADAAQARSEAEAARAEVAKLRAELASATAGRPAQTNGPGAIFRRLRTRR